MADQAEVRIRCRIETYFNQYDYQMTGLRVWKPSTLHYFVNDKNSCDCGKAWW